MKKMTGKVMRIAAALGICASLMLGTPGMSICAMAATSTVDGAMIRSEPSTDAGIIGSLYEGDEVTVLGARQSGDGYTWYYIQLDNGNTGYVRGDLLSVDDSEIEALGLEENESGEEGEETQEPEETTEEEAAPEAEPAAEESQEQETQEEAPAEADNAQPQEQSQDAPAAESGEYDAAKDPNANLRLVFENEENGRGSWYVYNDDNGTKIRVGDMTSQAQAEQAARPAAGPWKTAAIIFGLIAVALAAFVLFMLKSIRDDRNTIARRRVARGADSGPAAESDYDDGLLFDKDESFDNDESFEKDEASDDDEDSEKDEVFFGDRGEELPEDAEDAEEVTEEFEDSTVEYDEPPAYEEKEIPEIGDKDSHQGAFEDSEKVPETAEAQDVQEEEDLPEEDDLPRPEPAAAMKAAQEEAFEDGEYVSGEEDAEEEVFDEDREETRDEANGEPDEEYGEDFEEADGEYDEESDEYFEELPDEEEDRASGRPQKRASNAGGGIAGFFRKLFGSDSKEDDDEYEDDEYDDDEEFVFDEYKEYPEDVDLLPREDGSDDFEDYDEEDYDDEEYDEEEETRARLSVQRVMKRAGKGEREEDFSDEEDPDGFKDGRAEEDLSEPLFDDDDDMEYSFLGSRSRR